MRAITKVDVRDFWQSRQITTGSIGIEGAGRHRNGRRPKRRGRNRGRLRERHRRRHASTERRGGTFDVDGTFTNNGVFAVGNLDDQLSTLVTLWRADERRKRLDPDSSTPRRPSLAPRPTRAQARTTAFLSAARPVRDQTSLDVIGAFTNTGELSWAMAWERERHIVRDLQIPATLRSTSARRSCCRKTRLHAKRRRRQRDGCRGHPDRLSGQSDRGSYRRRWRDRQPVSNTGGNLLAGSSVTTPGELDDRG